MKTDWDYTNLAQSYLKRPGYSEDIIDTMLKKANISTGMKVCDVGAGTANLTLMIAKRNLNVTAIEPNTAMRSLGIERTARYNNVVWFKGTGENTGQPDSIFDLVTFGSSFNVTNRALALKETRRILKKNGWFACIWNYRDLNDPIQSSIENIIKSHIKDYSYGTRREDQTEIINQSGLFNEVVKIESKIKHIQTIEDCLCAWRSHATLYRQAKNKAEFIIIISKIEKVLRGTDSKEIMVPYITKVWLAQAK